MLKQTGATAGRYHQRTSGLICEVVALKGIEGNCPSNGIIFLGPWGPFGT